MSLRKCLALPLALLVGLSCVASLGAQTGTSTVGIAINDATVIAKCSGCHTRDSNGTMARLSEIRTTPEVWEQAIKRMVRLNGLQITPVEARQVVRYLSDNNGLTLAEAKVGFWDAEHRNFRLAEEANGTPQELQRTCNYCHSIGRVLVQRRTQADYTRLMNTHMALFPGSEASVFRPFRRYTNPEDLSVELTQAGTGYGVLHYTEPAPPPAKTPKYPVDVAIEYLAKSQPLITPEWTAWHAAKHEANPAGTWTVRAYQAGKGRIYGEMTVLPPDKSGDWTTTTTLHYPDGQTIRMTGRSVLYAGYSWRGHSKAAMDPKASPTLPTDSREAMLLASDGSSMEGRWFWGGYQEFGLDVKLTRLDKQMTVLGVDKYALRSPSAETLHVYGGGLPASLTPADFNFGDGVAVSKVLHASADDVELLVTVAAGVKPGLHTVQVKGVSAPETIAVYDKIDFIKVAPDANYARLGGIITVKQFAQFQAIGYSNGADGLPGTNDDVAIGPVKAAWSLEEFYATPDDDDVKYVGTIDESGLFTPNVEGPNPMRQKQANNFPTENWGDVWVNAVYKGPTGEPLQARSYLVVTVPTYMRYDQPEVTE